MKKIAKTSLAILALMSMGVMNASAKTLKASDIAELTEDPVYIRGNSAFIGKLTTTDMLRSFEYDGNLDPMLYLKYGDSWLYADTGETISAEEVEKLKFDITRIVGEKTGDHISENSSVYTEDKYGYRVNKDTVYEYDSSRTAEYFMSAKESNTVEAMKTIFDLNDENVTSGFDADKKLATVTLKDGDKLSTIQDIINGFGEVLKTNSYTNIELVYGNDVVVLTEDMVNVEDENEQLTTEITSLLAKMLGNSVSSETDISNLFNKSFTVRFNTTDEDNKSVSSEYEVEFYTNVDTNAYFVEGTDKVASGRNQYNVYTLTCRGNAGEKCTPVINVLDEGKGQTISKVELLTNSIKAAIESGKVASVDLSIGSSSTTNTTNKTFDTVPLDSTVTNWIKSAINEKTTKYTNLASLGNLTITFNLKEGANSIYSNEEDPYSYTISIGQYVDIDSIINNIIESNNNSNLGDVDKSNNYYHLSRKADDNSKLVFDVNLKNNGLYRFSEVLNGFDGIMKDALTAADISAITINGQEFNHENKDSQSLDKILKALTPDNKLNANNISNLVLDVTFNTANNKHLMPGTYGTVVAGEESDKVTYQLSFNMNNFDVDNIFTYLKDTNETTHFTYTIDNESNVITAKLTNINDSLADIDITDSLGLLDTFGNLIKEVQINNNSPITLAQEDAKQQIVDAIKEIVAASGAEKVADLTKLEDGITFKLVLADNVYTGAFTYDDETFVAGTKNEDSNEYTLKFDSSVSNVEITADNKNSINELIKAGAEKITLSSDIDLGSGIKIENATKGLEIVGNAVQVTGDIEVASGSNNVNISDVNVTGNVKVSSKDVTIADSNITGDVTTESGSEKVTIKDTTITGEVKVEGKEATITGTPTPNDKGEITESTTTINGALTVKGENFTMNGAVVKGTDAKVDADESSNKIAVIDADEATGMTIKNSRIEYNGNKTLTEENKDSFNDYVYSLVYTSGTVDLEGNTFVITNVKNPIEFVYGSSKPVNTGTVISGNHFVGNNYVADESHNVISIYGAADNNAVVKIENNTFDYASSVLRITDTTSKTVTYEVNNNTVVNNNGGDKEKTKTLIVVRTNNSAKDLSHIKINAKENTLADNAWSEEKLVSIIDDSSHTGNLTLNGSQYQSN